MSCGYSTALFLDHIARNHRCGLCRQVMRGPVSTKCGHVYCFGCVKGWIDKYGLCPLGCDRVSVSDLSAATDIEEEIYGLFVKCNNCKSGCTKIMRLSELSEHQFDCEFSLNSSENSAKASWNGSQELPVRSSSFSIPKQSTKFRRSSAHKLAPAREATKAVITVKIDRVSGESMGFHVVGGEKAFDEITISGVLVGFPAHKAGLLDNDKILKVDGVEVATLMHHEVVDLMQHSTSNPLSVMVERTCHPYNDNICHRYEEIQPLPQNSTFSLGAHTLPSSDGKKRKMKGRDNGRQEIRLSPSFSSPRDKPLSSSAMALSRHSFANASFSTERDLSSHFVHPSFSSCNIRKEASTTVLRTPSLPIKKRSIQTIKNVLGVAKKPQDKNKQKRQTPPPPLPSSPTKIRESSPVSNGPDSGLSSGDKSPPPTALQRNSQYRISLRTQKEMKQIHQRQRRASSPSKPKPKNKQHQGVKCTGDYEVEEITLHKSMSSRLGVTLGYDEKSEDSSIYVVEILPDGIAAKDARLQVGDIITKVNGFEVFDTEEAILYFLEQDPEIVLSVSRLINKKPDVALESSPLCGLRRYDSCGSLDSRTVTHVAKTDCKSSSSGYNSQEYDTMQRGEKTAEDKGDRGKFRTCLVNQVAEMTKCEDLTDSCFRLHTPSFTSTETQV